MGHGLMLKVRLVTLRASKGCHRASHRGFNAIVDRTDSGLWLNLGRTLVAGINLVQAYTIFIVAWHSNHSLVRVFANLSSCDVKGILRVFDGLKLRSLTVFTLLKLALGVLKVLLSAIGVKDGPFDAFIPSHLFFMFYK